jgi:hypothetical protein
MKRVLFASSVIVVCAFGVVSVLAQSKAAQTPAAKPATQAPATSAAPTAGQQAPAAPAKFIKPLKGTADIQFIQMPSKKVGSDIVTVLKIKNLSTAPVSLLKVDEYWYNKGNPPAVVTGDSEAWRKPFMPGEVIELTMKSPYKADVGASQYQFSHAGGQVKLKRVTKFD